MDTNILANDLFTAIEYIAENTAQKYDNIIVGTIVGNNNQQLNRYDVKIDKTVYRNLYCENTDLSIDDQVYLIKLNNEDNKVVIGGLYYPNAQIINSDLNKTFVPSSWKRSITNMSVGQSATILDFERHSTDVVWADETYTRMRIKTKVYPNKEIDLQNLDSQTQLGDFGLNLIFQATNNEVIEYKQTFDKVITSDNLTRNPYLITPAEGATISAVLDISKISDIYNSLQLQAYSDINIKNLNYTFTNIEVELGYDIVGLTDNKLVLGLSQNDNQDYSKSLYYSSLDKLDRQLSLTFIDVNSDKTDFKYITQMNDLTNDSNAEVRWYKYIYGELANDEYGGEDWRLLDRLTANNVPVTNNLGYYTPSIQNQNFTKDILLNLKEDKIIYKAILIYEDQAITSNTLTFTNEKVKNNISTTTEISNSNLIFKLNEYIEYLDTNEQIQKQTVNYNGNYHIYSKSGTTTNLPIIQLQLNPIETEDIHTIIWEVPMNSQFLVNHPSDRLKILNRNNQLIIDNFDLDFNIYKTLLYSYLVDEDSNKVYFLRTFYPRESQIQSETDREIIQNLQQQLYFELELENQYSYNNNNTIKCYCSYSRVPSDLTVSIEKDFEDNSDTKDFQAFLDTYYNNNIKNATDGKLDENDYLLGYIYSRQGTPSYNSETKIATGSETQSFTEGRKTLFKCKRWNYNLKTFYFGYEDTVDGYTLDLQFLPKVGYGDSTQAYCSILNQNNPFTIIQATLFFNGNTIDLSNYSDEILGRGVFSELTNKLLFKEIDIQKILDLDTNNSQAIPLISKEYLVTNNNINQRSKYWIVLPQGVHSLPETLYTYNDLSFYFNTDIIAYGRTFRNILISLGYCYNKSNTRGPLYNYYINTLADLDTRQKQYLCFNIFKRDLIFPNELSYEDILEDNENFLAFWNKLNSQDNYTIQIDDYSKNLTYYKTFIEPLQRISNKSSAYLKKAYRAYCLCYYSFPEWQDNIDAFQFITDTENEDRQTAQYIYGELLEGPGMVVPTQQDLSKDGTVDQLPTLEVNFNKTNYFQDWRDNYNIFKCTIPSLKIDQVLPIAISLEGLTAGQMTSGFIGDLTINYQNNGKLLNKRIYNYDCYNSFRKDTQSNWGAFLRTTDNYVQNHTQFVDYFQDLQPVVGESNQLRIGKPKKAGELLGITYGDYSTNFDNEILQNCIVFCSRSDRFFIKKVIVPLYFNIERNGNSVIAQDNGITVVDKENQKITTSTSLIGSKDNINNDIYSGWYLDADGATFYQQGQEFFKVDKNSILTIGPSGEGQMIINPKKSNITIENGSINFNDLYNIVNMIVNSKKLKLGNDNVVLDGDNKKLELGNNVILNGNDKSLKLGDNLLIDGDDRTLTSNNYKFYIENNQLIFEKDNTVSFIFDFNAKELLLTTDSTRYKFNKTQSNN